MPVKVVLPLYQEEMKRALLVGIDRYACASPLSGCVNDVKALKPLLARNEDDSPNFDCKTKTSGSEEVISRNNLLGAIDALLAPGARFSLFYFAGHGKQVDNDVMLLTEDGCGADLGVSMSSVLAKVQSSQVPEVSIILDCCFSGIAGGVPQLGSEAAVLRSGVSILTASRGNEVSVETPKGRGLFSTYLCGALEGGAADILGKVTIAGVYAYLSESFNSWNQRPMFKANVERLHYLRRAFPAVPLHELRRLPEFFNTQDEEMPLDRTYEPTENLGNEEHEAIFAILQRCRAAKLVEPVGEQHMYYAAVNEKSCRLTPLGKLYWSMAKRGGI
ncbi:MAG TPA: caspase family protein [Pyrinomonadaceae bacterium]|nr:caspase family protein [Pyrinomonadaceae bacterium]